MRRKVLIGTTAALLAFASSAPAQEPAADDTAGSPGESVLFDGDWEYHEDAGDTFGGAPGNHSRYAADVVEYPPPTQEPFEFVRGDRGPPEHRGLFGGSLPTPALSPSVSSRRTSA